MSVSVILKLHGIRITWKDLLQHTVSPTPRISDPVGLGKTQECISNKFQGDVNDAGLVATLWGPLVSANSALGMGT